MVPLLAHELDGVVDDAVGVGDPLGAGHELVPRARAKGVDDPSVPSGEPGPSQHRVLQALELLVADGAHRPGLHDEIDSAHEVPVEVGVQRVRHHDVEALLDEKRPEATARLLGLVALPAAPDDQRGRHRR